MADTDIAWKKKLFFIKIMKTESYSGITALIRISFCYSVKFDNMESQVTGKNSIIDRFHSYYHCIKLFFQTIFSIKLFRLIIAPLCRVRLDNACRYRYFKFKLWLPLIQKV